MVSASLFVDWGLVVRVSRYAKVTVCTEHDVAIQRIRRRLGVVLLNGEVFYSLKEAQIIIEKWRKHDNSKRPYNSLGYRPPAPETIIPMDERTIMN